MFETMEKTLLEEPPKAAAMEGTPTPTETEERTWIEEIEVAGNQLVERVKEVIAEGNVRRLILRTEEGKLILEIPLTTGTIVGGVVTLFAPLLAALGAMAALLARVKVQIVRVEEKGE